MPKHACEKCETPFDVPDEALEKGYFVRYSCHAPECPRCPACGLAVRMVNYGKLMRDYVPQSYQEIGQPSPSHGVR